MSDYDEMFHVKFSVETQLSLFRTLLDLNSQNYNLVATLKYWSAWPLAFFLRNDEPAGPVLTNKYLVDKPLAKYIKQRLMGRKSKTNLKLFWSMLQGFKRACKEAPFHFVVQSYVKHAKTLSTEPSKDVVTENFHFETRDRVEEAQKIFYRPKLDSIWSSINPYELKENLPISASACLELQRSVGGSRSHLMRWFHDLNPDDDHDTIGQHEQLLGMVETKPGVVKEARGIPPPTLGKIRDYILENHNEEYHECKVAAVLEPLKVRLITKGVSLPYFYSRTMQKLMHTHLRRIPQFSAIGEPLREDHIYDMISRERELDLLIRKDLCTNLAFDSWVSGDYSAATDGLDINCTIEAFESVCDAAFVPETDRVILRRVLYSHKISYPDKAESSCDGDLALLSRKLVN
jgi:hypothetical protein